MQNAAGTYYKKLTWADKEDIGARQMEFARKANAFAETREAGVNVASSPFYDFLYMLRTAIETERSFDPEKVKRAMDATKGYDGLLGTLNFTENKTRGHFDRGPDRS